jgi:uncharacterized protein (TIGR01777 family)
MTKKILIAGGTGLIGKQLTIYLRKQGHMVDVLTRNPKHPGEYKWDPERQVLDYPKLSQIEVLINLSGAGIGDARWTDSRKEELIRSRVGTNRFLFEKASQMVSLEQFISSSGINAYGFSRSTEPYKENDPFGNDFVSALVRSWEESADLFQVKCKVCKLRTAVVLDAKGGALKKMLPPVKMGIGSPLGKGDQIMSWIHTDDLLRIFQHVITQQLEGPYNALAANTSNAELMKTLAKVLNKPFFFPKVPEFVLKLAFGEMSELLLQGVSADNSKLRSTGFEFDHSELESTLKALLP